MAGKFEKTYGKVMSFMLFAVNPVKKVVIEQPECKIHKLINYKALEILKNDKYLDAHSYFYDFIDDINDGVVWADLDLKSSGHFYNPVKKRGLYGRNNALTLADTYYSSAINHWKENDINKAMFYLGAAVHLVQDMTIPQHANIRLLDDHRQYENYIRKTCQNTPQFNADRGGYYLESIEEFITCNARNAIKIYTRLKHIKDLDKRFFTMTKFTLPLAQKTTAGCFLRFYKDVSHYGFKITQG